MCFLNRTALIVLATAAFSASADGQPRDADPLRLATTSSEPAGGPFLNVPILNAPFSADAITTVREALPDGSVQEHTLTAHYYRDSHGRVRAEVDTAWGPYVVLCDVPDEGGRGPCHVLSPKKRTYRVGAGLWNGKLFFNGEGRVALPVGNVTFRQAPPVEGASEDERLHAVNAQVSPELGVVVSSYRADHIGSVDYNLTNIRAAEPSADLFIVPPDYTFVSGSRDDLVFSLRPWGTRTP